MSPSTIRNLKALGLILYIAFAIGMYLLGLHAWPQLKANGIDDGDRILIGILTAPAAIPMAALALYAVWIVTIHNPNPGSDHTSYHSGESI